MRKSIITGLTLCAALAFAGQALADGTGSAVPVNQSHKRHKHPSRMVEARSPTYLRNPANPVVRDCVHVIFPQCSYPGGLNDGTFEFPY
jgi:hypothetical protein